MKQIVGDTKHASFMFVFFMLIFATIQTSSGANRYLVASGDWNSINSWSLTSGGDPGASVPVSGDVVYIENGFIVTVTQDAVCGTIYFGQNDVSPGGIIINTGVKLGASGGNGVAVFVVPRDGSNSSSCTISGGGTFYITSLTIGSTSITPTGLCTTTLVSTLADVRISGNLNLVSDYSGSSSNQNIPRFYLNEGVVTITGNIVPTVASVAGDVYFRMDQGNHTGTLKLEAPTPWSTDMDFVSPWGSGSNSTYYVYLNAVGATVDYNGSAQTVRQLTYNNLTLSGSGAKTLSTAPTVNGVLSLQGTATCVNSPVYGASSTLEYKSSSPQNTTANEFVSGANGPLNLIIDNPNGISLHVAKILRTGSPNTLTLRQGTLTNTNNITLSDNSTIVRVGGTISAIPVFGANVNVVYSQHTVNVLTGKELPLSSTTILNNLTIDNTKGVSLAANTSPKGATVVNGTLVCGSYAVSGSGSFVLNDGSVLKTASATGINGSITVSGTKTFSAGASYSFNGSVGQVTGSLMPSVVKNLTIENTNASGVVLTNDVDASGLVSVLKILNCTEKIITGSGAFSLASGATIITAHAEGVSLTGTTGAVQVSGTRTFNTLSNFTFNGTTAQITGSAIANINKLVIANLAGVTLTSTVSAPAVCRSLLILSGSFVIDVNNAITVTGTTTLNGAQCLVIKSTPEGTGSLIDNGFDGTGTAKIERWVSNNGNQRWEYVSSPIKEASSTVFTSSIHSLRWADEVNNKWVKILHSSPQTMEVYKGYTRSYQATNDGENSAAVFVGVPNSGSLSPIVTYTADAPGVGHGWNLIGNPYTSAIDWNSETGWTKENINDAIYFRKNGYVCTYVGGFGTNDATNYIPPMQAFWIRVTDENGGTLSSDNSVRVHQEARHYKGSKTIKNTIHLTIATADNSKKDDAYVCFRDGASNNYDSKLDAFKLYSDDASYPQIYSITGADTMVINNLEPLSGERIVKLGFKNLVPGTYTIRADMISTLTSNGNSVLIENTQTGASQDLSDNNKYTFTVGAKANVDNLILRFNGGLLPIQLIDFEPVCFNNEVQINWSTASETNNNYFTIERSADGIEWEFVNKTQGSGNSNIVQKYSVVDSKRPDGVVYYRLTQTDFDGKSKTFNAEAVSCNEKSDNIVFYPNPFTSSVKVMLGDVKLVNGTINIYNALGVEVFSKVISSNDLDVIEIDLPELSKGVFTIVLKSDSLSRIEKIIKK